MDSFIHVNSTSAADKAVNIKDAPKDKSDKTAAFSRHPFLWLAVACLYICAVFDVTAAKPVSAASAIFVLGSCAAAVLAAVSYMEKSGRAVFDRLSVAVVAALCALFFTAAVVSGNTVIYLAVFSLVLIVIAGIYLLVTKKLTPERLCFLLVCAGFVLRAAYILYTSVTQRQHDVWYFANDTYDIGHAGYIEYFYNNMRLPDFDPRTVWQYYHPPLHHITAAIWMRINTALGMSYDRAVENIQILTLYYSSACMIISYKLFKELGLKKWGIGISTALICFHPTFILLSGSVNNDILSVFLAFAAILAAVRWYKKPCMRRIIPIALFIGLAMMAKMSAALVAPAVAAVFLIAFIKGRSSWQGFILQFAVFAVICVPLGLWWQISNYIRFGMPITYVPMLSENSDQYIGFHSVLERLFDFRLFQLDSVFIAWNPERNGASYYEYNVFIALLKSSVFGEFSPFYMSAADATGATGAALTISKLGNALCTVLFYVNLLAVVGAVAGGIKALFTRKSPLDFTMRIFFALLFATVLGSYVNFCIMYPHTCTMNMRYAVPLILCCALFMGVLAENPPPVSRSAADVPERSKAIKRAVKYSAAVITVLFCVCSAAVYLLLSQVQ